MTTTCGSNTGTYTTKSTSVSKLDGDKFSGRTTTITTKNADGTVIFDCSYDSTGEWL
jgi:hypothetical protein